MSKGWKNDTVNSTPIVQADVGARLDAIVRRHGGTPKAQPTSKPQLPPVGRRECKGQLSFDDVVEQDSDDAEDGSEAAS